MNAAFMQYDRRGPAQRARISGHARLLGAQWHQERGPGRGASSQAVPPQAGRPVIWPSPGTDRTLESAEDRWMLSHVTAEGSGWGREIPAPDIPRR